MSLLRRDVPTDPVVVARLRAVFPSPAAGPGWVPPRGVPGAGLDDGSAAVDDVEDPVDATAAGTEQDDATGQAEADRPAGQPGSPWERWRQARIDPGRRGLAALLLVAVLAALLAGFVVLRSRPHAVSLPTVVASGVPVPGSSGTAAATPTPSAATGGEVVVAVGGAVPRPGLVHLPVGSRVDDAVRAAGGALPGTDLGALNLARRLVDGEQVLVGVAAAAGPVDASPGAGATAGPLDLNTASAAELDALPGIGPVLAQKIVDWRTEHGRFGSVDQLREVSGIGESKYGELKDKVRV